MPVLTVSGNEITDAVRTTGTSGDGLTPPAGFGIWPAATNLCPNGGFESGTTNWSAIGAVTLTQSTTQAKFGTHSLKCVTTGGSQGPECGGGVVAVSAATAYTFSFWVFSSGSVSLTPSWDENIGGSYNNTKTGGTVALSAGWQRLSMTATTAASITSINIYAEFNGATTAYVDGVQVEAGTIATPYVETSSAPATRSAARVQAPASLLDETTGWVAVRIYYGFPSTATRSSACYVLDWRDNSSNLASMWLDTANKWNVGRELSGSGSPALSAAQTFSIGGTVTVIAAWDAGHVYVSVNGGSFTAVANTSIPTLAASLFDFGSQGGATQVDCDILWAATGLGTLSNGDASALNGYSTPQTLAALRSAFPAGNVTGAWAAVTSTYEVYSAPAPPATNVGFVAQLSLSNPQDLVQNWVDVTPYVQQFHTTRAKQRQMQRFEAATMDMTLINNDRRFDTTYTGSPYYPFLLPMRQIRVGFVSAGVITWVYTGYVERWPQVYQGATYAEIDLTAVDGFELLANHYLSSVYASLTTSQGSNRDLVFTSTTIGFLGDSTSIAYVNPGGTGAISVTATGLAVTVNLAVSSGTIVSTANDVLNAVNASTDPTVQSLVQTTGFPSPVVLAPGSDGTGTVQAMAATPMAGGTFLQQLTGSYINQILDATGWVTPRNISPGVSQVQAQSIPNDGSVHALDQIYAATQTENGQFFFDAQGRPTFLDRTALSSSPYLTPLMVLTDYPNNTTTFGYTSLAPSLDKDLIFNDIRVTRENGILQVLDDSTSDSEYFTRTLSVDGVLSTTDVEANYLGQALLNQFKQPILRFDPLTVSPGANYTFWQALLGLELMKTVTVYRTPPGASQVIADQVQLIGIEIQGQAGPVSTIVWTLTIDPQSAGSKFFILNDTTYGTLDNNYLGF